MKNNFFTYNSPFFDYRRAPSINVIEPHFHKYYEIYYLISGSRRYFIENEIYDVLPGDIILIPEMTTHKVLRAPDSSPNEYHERFLLSPHKEDIPEVFLPCFNTHIYHLPKEAKKEIENCFQSLQARSEKRDKYRHYHNLANLYRILCTLTSLPTAPQEEQSLSKNDLIMQDAASYIKENFTHSITLEDLAKKYSFSKEYFSALFKQTTGFGFNEYLNQMRIAHATNLLISSSTPITEIGELCGFNDSNYFSKVFKKTTGTSPMNFRATHQTEK